MTRTHLRRFRIICSVLTFLKDQGVCVSQNQTHWHQDIQSNESTRNMINRAKLRYICVPWDSKRYNFSRNLIPGTHLKMCSFAKLRIFFPMKSKFNPHQSFTFVPNSWPNPSMKKTPSENGWKWKPHKHCDYYWGGVTVDRWNGIPPSHRSPWKYGGVLWMDLFGPMNSVKRLCHFSDSDHIPNLNLSLHSSLG